MLGNNAKGYTRKTTAGTNIEESHDSRALVLLNCIQKQEAINYMTNNSLTRFNDPCQVHNLVLLYNKIKVPQQQVALLVRGIHLILI